MLWRDLKQATHARKPSSVVEFNWIQFCKEESAMWKTRKIARLQLLPPRVTLAVIRFRRGTDLDSFYPLIKWSYIISTVFCIYSSIYLRLNLRRWAQSILLWQICKEKYLGTFSQHCIQVAWPKSDLWETSDIQYAQYYQMPFTWPQMILDDLIY